MPTSAWLLIDAVAYSDKISVPELNPDDLKRVSTLMTRFANPKPNRAKWNGLGGHDRGVTKTPDVHDDDNDLVIVTEGASDVAGAIAAGLPATSRPGKNAGIDKFVGAFRKVSPDAKIILFVENDKPRKDWTGTVEEFDRTIDEAANAKAQELADELLRPIHVFRPPREAGDLIDWWKLLTDNQGHLMSEADRHRVGREMRHHMSATGEEVGVSPDVMDAHIEKARSNFEQEILLGLEKKKYARTVAYTQDDPDFGAKGRAL